MERRLSIGSLVMEKRDCALIQLWRVSLLCAVAMLWPCVLSLNEEGRLLLNWKQDYLQDQTTTSATGMPRTPLSVSGTV